MDHCLNPEHDNSNRTASTVSATTAASSSSCRIVHPNHNNNSHHPSFVPVLRTSNNNNNNNNNFDRPPRSPIRSVSLNRNQVSFTRSRVFPSIRRRTQNSVRKRTTTTTVITLRIRLCIICSVSVLLILCIYWYNVQKTVRSRFLLHFQSWNQTALTNPSVFPTDGMNQNGLLPPPQQQQQPQTVPTMNPQNHKNTNVNKIRTREERIAPLLEVVDQITSRNGAKRNWTHYHRFKRIHRMPTTTTMTTSKDHPVTTDVDSCIVTAYFRLPNGSKHHVQQYDGWMQNMLSMPDCMVIYCESEMVPIIQQYRRRNATTSLSDGTTTTTSSIGPTTIIEMSIDDLPVANYYYNYPNATIAASSSSSPQQLANEFWNDQLQRDRERQIHKSYQLFWIWLSKSWFVSTAALLQHHLLLLNTTMRIETWMWADIGSFRGTEYMNQRLIQQRAFIPDNNTVVWMAHRIPNPPFDPYWNHKLVQNEKHHFYHSGSQAIANSVVAWVDFHKHFVRTLDAAVVMKHLFIGEDQCILQTTCLLYPASCAYIPYNQVRDNKFFGLRHIVRYGPYSKQQNHTKKRNSKQQPFHLWRPPLRQ